MTDDLTREETASLYDKLASTHPKLSRGRVWCAECGRTEKVDSAIALRSGWPKCCGYTMTIDSPQERKEQPHD